MRFAAARTGAGPSGFRRGVRRLALSTTVALAVGSLTVASSSVTTAATATTQTSATTAATFMAASTALAGTTAAAPAPGERRFALAFGNDDGGPPMRPLLYASEDARKMHALFTQLAGVRPEDATLLVNRSAAETLTALARLEASAATATSQGTRTVLFVYYSGHAKDGQLRLGASRLDLRGLADRLRQSPAHVTVGIFDSCQAGVVTRSKGARKGPAFAVEANGGSATRGLVLLTSSSADEDAQESDTIGGSYFSHHLIAAMRGSADRSGDRRVTLSEAYAYAHARTVADTADTAAGAQHPTFAFDLKGNGDLVLTDLASRREGLIVPATAPAGTYYIVDASAGLIVTEVDKPAGVDRQIALAPGWYRIKRRLPDRLRLGDVAIAPGQLARLDEARLRDAPFSDDPVKGVRRELPSRLHLGVTGAFQSFLDQATRASLFPATGMLGLDLGVRDYFRQRWTWGLDLALGSTRGELLRDGIGVPLPFVMTELGAGLSLYRELPILDGRLTPFVGGRLAFLLMARTFEGPAATVPKQAFATFSPGLVAGLRADLPWGFVFAARSRVHYVLYNLAEQSRSLAYLELGGQLGYEF